METNLLYPLHTPVCVCVCVCVHPCFWAQHYPLCSSIECSLHRAAMAGLCSHSNSCRWVQSVTVAASHGLLPSSGQRQCYKNKGEIFQIERDSEPHWYPQYESEQCDFSRQALQKQPRGSTCMQDPNCLFPQREISCKQGCDFPWNSQNKLKWHNEQNPILRNRDVY